MKNRIFTDGACSGNPGPGGWASIFCTESDTIILSGGEENTTNNRMELFAAVRSFEKILADSLLYQAPHIQFEIFSDSAYVVNAINKDWIFNWCIKGWKTSTGDDVKNKELWQRLYKAITKAKEKNIAIDVIKIKGHSGNSFNELADEVAKKEVQKIKDKKGRY